MEDEKKVQNNYCVCNVFVSQGDPDSVVWKQRRLHKKCFRTKVAEMVQQEARSAEQQVFAFVTVCQ
jgi:hypothetical protein